MSFSLPTRPPARVIRTFLALLVIGGSFGVFYLNSKDSGDLGPVERALLRLTAPAQGLVSGAWQWGEERWDEYLALVDVSRENLRLREEVRVLRERVHQGREAELENRRLRRLLQLGERVRLSYRPARVVAFDPMSRYRTLRIDRGSEGGVARGQPVMTEEGVVGRVHRVWAHHADVLLLTDTRSAVDGFIQRTRDQGTIEGLGTGECRMKYLLRGADVRDGDVVVTSGYDGIFPRGLPVGVIRGDDPNGFGGGQVTEVIPYVDLTRVEEVLVLDAGPALLSEEGWLGDELR